MSYSFFLSVVCRRQKGENILVAGNSILHFSCNYADDRQSEYVFVQNSTEMLVYYQALELSGLLALNPLNTWGLQQFFPVMNRDDLRSAVSLV